MEKNRRKRVLFISSKKPFPVQDGAAIRTMQMYWMLSRYYDIDLIYSCNKKEDSSINSVDNLKIKSCKGFYLPKWRSLMQTGFALFSQIPLQCAYFFNKGMYKYIKSHLNNYDYVFCNNIRTALYVVNDSRCIRYIDFVDAISMNYKGASSKHRFPLSLLYQEESRRLLKMEIKLSKLFDKAIIISDIDSNYIKNHSQSPIREIEVVPNSVDIPDEIILQSENFNIVFVGSMFYDPNIVAVTTFAKHVFPLILKKFPNAKFYIVGNRPSKNVKKLASENIIVTGFVNDPKEYLRISNIVVAPMYSGAGVQNKILEAMSMGCCVVTTTIGSEGLGNIMNGQEISIENQYESMASSIIKLLSDKEARQNMGMKAKEYVKLNFSFNKVFQLFTDRLINE
jgi:glycosyltransferase, family 1